MQIALTAKIQLNMHNLNNERAEEIRRVPVLYKVKDKEGKGAYKLVEEAVAISGVMLKHYHFANMVEFLQNNNGKLCLICSRREAIRVPSKEIKKEDLANWLGIKENDKLLEDYTKIIWNKGEDEIIKNCAGEDVHGFLRPNPPLRRESLIKFSWMLPTYINELEDFGTPTPFTVLQHTRNIRNIPEKISTELKQMQMPYPRAYGSGVFAFSSIADLGKVGYSFTSKNVVLEEEERVLRRKAIILGYVPLVSGLAGASLARALPSVKIMELICVVVMDTPVSIPAPTSPIYDDYYPDLVNIYKGFANLTKAKVKIFSYGFQDKLDEIVELVNEPFDVFIKALKFFNLE
ncbi:MAG: DevR family CRISPR-associated autoregulator [Nitrososphaerales archaeon]